MFNVKNILVPVDFSDQAKLSLDVAINLAKIEKDATIHLLHVLPFLIHVEEPSIDLGVTDMDIQQWNEASELLEEWRERIPPPVQGRIVIKKGRLDKAIAGACGERKIDLVIMTTHGRGGLERLVHPNVTERVVRTIPCPVLVLHLNRQTQEMAEQAV